ncbi:MAG: cell division protein FtsL [Alphaproteobacteria bacterium]|jgi:cell division protein FtsL
MPVSTEKPLKIVAAIVVIILTLFVIGIFKEVPVYEVRKEVSL